MKKLSGGQITVLVLATIPMIAVGVGGAIGTYANAASVLHRKETALGVVAAGEGATLVAAIVMIGVTMLGQTAPLAIRAALWLLPAAASVMGLSIAPTRTEAVVFALTPLAMTAAAEGISFLARRIVVHATGVDIEAQRRNAAVLRRIAYHRARAERHPWKRVRKVSELMAWRLVGRLGHGDAALGSALTDVQNARVTSGADVALAAMFSSAPKFPPVAAPRPPATPRPPLPPSPATPEPAGGEAPATPPPAGDLAEGSAVDGPDYAAGTPHHVVRALWLSLGHRPTEGQIVQALGAAGLANSRAQAGKIRRQVEGENRQLPGPRAA